MDHQYVEEHNIIERYLLGKLPAEVRDEFEEHYFECEACLEQLEVTEDFRHALKAVAAEEAAWFGVTSGVGILGWLARLRPGRRAALLGSVFVLLVVLPVALLILARQELDQAKLASARLQQQLEQERESLQQERQRVERLLADPSRPSEARPQPGGDQPGIGATGGPDRLQPPEINIPIFNLNAVRRSGINEVGIPSTARSMVFALGLEIVKHETYRVTIRSGTRLIWSGDGLRPNQHDELTIGIAADYFTPGDYVLKLEGRTEEGEFVPVNEYPFRVIKQ